jgi:hypothetical protein
MDLVVRSHALTIRLHIMETPSLSSKIHLLKTGCFTIRRILFGTWKRL